MFDLSITLASALVGLVVGLTGMGGGALMTPMLVLFFGVQPLAAVSSDIVASLAMKPLGGGVHWRRGTVNRTLVKWLVLGSVPAAFAGVFLLKFAGTGPVLQARVKVALGIALLVVAVGLVLRPILARLRAAKEPAGPLVVKPVATLIVGVIGGLVVGMTSVGSGSLMMIMLLLLYPRLRLSELVGTDLVQAVPLVASAAIAHLIFGEFQAGLTASIVLGALPGVYVGARLSVRAPDHVLRPLLVIVLSASAMKLIDAEPLAFAATVLVLGITGIHSAVTARPPVRATLQVEPRPTDERVPVAQP
jgi:uncharacterized membrane protein YfcA